MTRVYDCLEAWAGRTPDATVLIEPRRAITYAALDQLANRVAHLLQGRGVTRGDRVAIALDNGVEMVAAYLGAQKAGAAAVPLPSGPRSDRLPAALADCEPRVCIVDGYATPVPSHRQALAAVPHVFERAGSAPGSHRWRVGDDFHEALNACTGAFERTDVTEEDLAAVIYTSGSTGRPRGVMLSHRNFVTNASAIVSYLGLSAADRVMCVLPFHYVYGLSLLHTHLMVGGSLVLENRSAFPNVVLEGMRAHAVTGFAGVPSTFGMLLHRSALGEVPLPHLRYVTQAGGDMPPARIAEWLVRGPRAAFYAMYGATEAAARLTYLPPADLDRKQGSIGRAVPGVEVWVATDDGRRAEPGEVGELVAKGPNIARGYWNDRAETARRFTPDGYRTGDLAYADREGYLYLVGRRQDILKVGAHRVAPGEIEAVLHQHPVVLEAAVVGTAHPLLGEAPVAYVTCRTAVRNAERVLRAHCADHLPSYKVPLRIVERLALPRLAGTGKLDRHALRGMAARLAVERAS